MFLVKETDFFVVFFLHLHQNKIVQLDNFKEKEKLLLEKKHKHKVWKEKFKQFKLFLFLWKLSKWVKYVSEFLETSTSTFNQVVLMLTNVCLHKLVWKTVTTNMFLKVKCYSNWSSDVQSHISSVVYDSTFRAYGGLEIWGIL